MRERILKIFVAETVPAWLSVSLILAGIVGTYFVTPVFTQRLNAGTIRTDFTIKTLDGLSERTRNLLAITSVVHQRLTHGKSIPVEDFDEAYRTIASLQWDILSFTILFADQDTRQLIGEYQQVLVKAQIAFQDLESSAPAESRRRSARMWRSTATS